jgi:hypothetical protein
MSADFFCNDPFLSSTEFNSLDDKADKDALQSDFRPDWFVQEQ